METILEDTPDLYLCSGPSSPESVMDESLVESRINTTERAVVSAEGAGAVTTSTATSTGSSTSSTSGNSTPPQDHFDEQIILNDSKEEQTFLSGGTPGGESEYNVEYYHRTRSRSRHRPSDYQLLMNRQEAEATSSFKEDTGSSNSTTTSSPSTSASNSAASPPAAALFPPIVPLEFDPNNGGIPLLPDYSISPSLPPLDPPELEMEHEPL